MSPQQPGFSRCPLRTQPGRHTQRSRRPGFERPGRHAACLHPICGRPRLSRGSALVQFSSGPAQYWSFQLVHSADRSPTSLIQQRGRRERPHHGAGQPRRCTAQAQPSPNTNRSPAGPPPAARHIQTSAPETEHPRRRMAQARPNTDRSPTSPIQQRGTHEHPHYETAQPRAALLQAGPYPAQIGPRQVRPSSAARTNVHATEPEQSRRCTASGAQQS